MEKVDRYEYTDWRNFGERVKNNREKIGLSKERFSEMINRSESYVKELDKGNKSCSVHTLHQVCKALRVSPNELLYGKAEEMDVKQEYSDKEIISNIIARCNECELETIKDVIIAIYPKFSKIIEDKQTKL